MAARKENAMERLTGIDINGVYLLKCLECSDFGKCASCVHKYKVFERLSEYEALGITPEQVREMDELYKKKCEEVSKLEKEKHGLRDTVRRKFEKMMQAVWETI